MKTKTTLSRWIDGKSEFPEHLEGRETLEKIKLYSAQLEAPAFNKQGVFESIKQAQANKNQSALKSYGLILKIAAVLILAFGVLAFFHQTSVQTTQTALAESKTLILPDDSEVLLLPGSQLSYNNMSWFLTREVSLQGEGFFEVAKGKTFTVNTKAGQVEVLGTKFKVKSTAEKLNVVCYEGRVKVSQFQNPQIINQNEYVIFKNNKMINRSKVQLNKLPTETTFYHIIDEEFEELIMDVERYYGIDISAENVSTDKHFTGKLPKNNIEKALEIISTTFQLKTQSLNGNNYIFVDDVNQ